MLTNQSHFRKKNPIRFAVVREDPCIEEACIAAIGGKSALLVASGGCTAFHLARCFPEAELALFDINPVLSGN